MPNYISQLLEVYPPTGIFHPFHLKPNQREYVHMQPPQSIFLGPYCHFCTLFQDLDLKHRADT